MQDRDLYAKMLGIEAPWEVIDVELVLKERVVNVMLAYRKDAALRCPQCDAVCPRYDAKQRKWRHLDTMQYETHLLAEVPRAECAEHGVHQIKVPWAEPGSRFTAMFEGLVIEWLKEATTLAVARLMGLSWDEVDGIMQRAVDRGLRRRRREKVPVLAVDEKAFKKGQEYVTIVCDALKGTVLHVAEDRKMEALMGFYSQLSPRQLFDVEAVAMDMWQPYIVATKIYVPHALVIFDRFHIARHLSEAVDKVRRAEHRRLLAQGDHRLTRSRYLWLKNNENLSSDQRASFDTIKRRGLQVARAYALKETARELWDYDDPNEAERSWKRWLGWAQRSRLEPMIRVGRMIRRHFEGVLNGVLTTISNAVAEGLNSRIQMIKMRACGFRNKERFKRAIYFHLGGLDLSPETAP
jgi:transposase